MLSCPVGELKEGEKPEFYEYRTLASEVEE